jgi:glc operon protein GlcG
MTNAALGMTTHPTNEHTTMKLLLALSLAIAAQPAVAQVATKKSLTLDGARRVIGAAQVEARKLNAPGGVIAVVDDGGSLISLERLDGTFAAGANISIGKARTALQFKRPTKIFEDIIRNGRTPMIALDDFTPLQGGIPILVDGEIVGAVGVSGAASAQQDEELAIAGAAAISRTTVASNGSVAPMVQYWNTSEVKAAFAKGAVLFDGAGDRNYMVHASRRDSAGLAEVHAKDTDIIYVLDGTATIVTGGSVVDGKQTASDEVRGKSIANGQQRKLTNGDVILVPNGTPHWFQDVRGPFTYFVVKVR